MSMRRRSRWRSLAMRYQLRHISASNNSNDDFLGSEGDVEGGDEKQGASTSHMDLY
jgi:hypothetical protein